MAPLSVRRHLPSLLAGALSYLLTIAGATAQDVPRGFGMDDVRTLLQAWPFNDPALVPAASLATGTGAAEATVKALADEIAYSARFVPTLPPPQITTDAAGRPPPDTTLWPEPVPADTFARAAARTDGALWATLGRRDSAHHAANAAALDDLVRAADRVAPGRIAFVWPERGTAVRDAVRPLVGSLEQRLRQRLGQAPCTETDVCEVMDLVQKKVAADGATSPIEDAIADFFFEAAKTGEFAESTAAQRAFSADRAAQRLALGLTPRAQTSPVAEIPWEMKLLVNFAVSSMRQLVNPTSLWPLRFTSDGANALRQARASMEPLRNVDLDGIAVTHYGRPLAGADGIFELAAALSFVDASARRSNYSLVLRFRVDNQKIEVTDGDLAAIAPARPRAQVAFVPATALTRAELAASDPEALLRAALNNRAARGNGDPADYYAFSFLLDATPPAAQIALRTALSPRGIAGYPGTPSVIDFGGWRVVVQRGTFAHGAAPAFFFKTLYRASPADPTELLDATPTFPDAPPPAGRAAAVRPAAALANRLPE